MAPTLTLDEFLTRHGGDYTELIDGIVVPLVRAGALCGFVGGRLINVFGGFVIERNLGVGCSHDTFVLIRKEPPRVRGADFCFWKHEAIPPSGMPEGVLESPPELCVEMRSPTYDWPYIFGKVADYLVAGVKVVVVLDPFTKTASAYRPDLPPETYAPTDTLTLPDILPGFSLPVARFFD